MGESIAGSQLSLFLHSVLVLPMAAFPCNTRYFMTHKPTYLLYGLLRISLLTPGLEGPEIDSGTYDNQHVLKVASQIIEARCLKKWCQRQFIRHLEKDKIRSILLTLHKNKFQMD